MKKTLQQLREGKEFHHYFKHHPNTLELRNGKGDHEIARGPSGMVVYPIGHELGKGLRATVIKMAIAAGLGILLLLMLMGCVRY
jgi:hypothetical protein